MSLLNESHPLGAAAAGSVSLQEELTGRKYWRSLEDMAEKPEFREFVEREFPAHASEMLSPFTRRTFLNLMSASMALAGLAGCRRPVEKILPYARRPEEVKPGQSLFYATSFEVGGVGVGVLAESREGRPIKLEGNPEHPTSLGALDARSHGMLLSMYDPDRSREPRHAGEPSTLEVFNQFTGTHFEDLAARGGAGLAFLSSRTASPSLLAMRAAVQAKMPQARWHVWDAVNDDNHILGNQAALGAASRAVYNLESVDTLVTIGGDPLNAPPASLPLSRGYARRRKPDHSRGMNRHYAAEAYFSLTGAKADHRLRASASRLGLFALKLAAKLQNLSPGLFSDPTLSTDLVRHLGHDFDDAFVTAAASDMLAKRGRALMLVGPEFPAEIHALAAIVNAAVGGPCVTYTPLPDGAWEAPGAGIAALTEALNAGGIDTLVTLCEGNPIYDAPADLNFAAAYAKAKTTIHLGLEYDETAAASSWHINRAHYLESWGDTRAHDGTIGITQPLIAPLYGGMTPGELLALIAGDGARPDYDILKQFHIAAGLRTEQAWKKAIHDGVIPGATAAPAPRTNQAVVAGNLAAYAETRALAGNELEINFLPDPCFLDGRLANNGWLMETPDPLTKMTWGNSATMNVATAKKLGVENGEILALSVGSRKAEVPAFVMPGLADGCVFVALGYGRKQIGRVGKDVGSNVYPLRTAAEPHFARGLAIEKTGETIEMACVQNHWALETTRPILREADADKYAADPGVIDAMTPHHPPLRSLFQERTFSGQQWGMSIDLSACTGCNACMVACQSENNIPVVGKKDVLMGREMSWIRIDRYFAADASDPDAAAHMLVQPMPCQHCEMAPCEQVCPVGATAHSPDGLNEMTYNRCIGTRYCSNNCPYKVRRFNFFNFNRLMSESEELVKNPDVTVRFRGVMEKCTFCVQRIRLAQEESILAGKDGIVADGAIVTACQATCPSEAIVFGDVYDPTTAVSKAKQLMRDYSVLPELNTRPRTTYLARINNPNPQAAG